MPTSIAVGIIGELGTGGMTNSMDVRGALTQQNPANAEIVCETGCEYVVDAFDCSPLVLRDMAALKSLCDRIVRDLGLNVVGEPQWHQFPEPGGVTGLYLLSESHLACHTYPEIGFASLNLYCCRRRTNWAWEEVLRAALEADNVTVRRLPRGKQPDEEQA